ncbi:MULTISPECIES: SrfA family protein [Enterobacteriaceae]|uniref:SrfA family protein n=1 Tax=Enterobacteriaceae TaxID=543 RepID=UPI000CDD6A91|nr:MULTISPECIES: SrfA family protein [Enterobacteriaceae]POU02074.1 ssrAB-activated protein [Escherichia sp. ESNIH1]
MAKTLLRSGDLDDFQAVGGGGQAVFDSALQIREALRLRKQQAMVDCLAIPQINDDGDRVDWYSPVEGRAVSWKAADDESRFRALRFLESTLDSAAALSRKSLQSPKTAQQLFGSLLEKALQFPGVNHVFLVDGKPVITFWGFVDLNESAREDVLACLREEEPPAPTIVMPEESEEEEETPAVATFSRADEPLLAAVPEMTTQQPPEPPQPEPQPAPVAPPAATEAAPASPKRRYGLWALPVAAVVVAAVAAPLLWPQQPAVSEPTSAATTAAAKPAAPQTIAPAPVASEPAPVLTASLPLHQAEVVAAKAPPAPEKPSEPTITAIPKDALVMDANQVKAGSTRFLNGSWRVMLDIKDEVTGKPPTLRFQIQNNKGTARLVQGNNIVCRSEIFSGLHDTGVLMIKSRGHARCSDGSRYPMPEISCTAGTSDVAQCTARYDAKTTVPLTFRKTGS